LQTISPPQRLSREGLAAECDVTPRRISYWITEGLVPPAHGTNPRNKWYGPDHVAAVCAVKTIREYNTRLYELGAYLREEGIPLVEYVQRRKVLPLRSSLI
jgi:DNA-binding transcriptional MerR regulator